MIKKFILKWITFLTIAIILGCSQNKKKLKDGENGFVEQKSILDSFQNPPDRYKPMPFWHINGHLTTEGIKKQMKDARELAGFSGISVLPLASKENGRPGTTPKFLSHDYLMRFQDVLNTADELDMEVILYDDNDFPSGMAGGKIGELFPDHTMKRLDKVEKEVFGSITIKDNVPNGNLLSVVAMNTQTLERIELSAYIQNGVLNWQVPNGKWKVMYFLMVKDGWHKAYPVVDYLDTTAVRHMINLTYDIYAKHFKSYFGRTIKKTFFDDIGLRGAADPGYRQTGVDRRADAGIKQISL